MISTYYVFLNTVLRNLSILYDICKDATAVQQNERVKKSFFKG